MKILEKFKFFLDKNYIIVYDYSVEKGDGIKEKASYALSGMFMPIIFFNYLTIIGFLKIKISPLIFGVMIVLTFSLLNFLFYRHYETKQNRLKIKYKIKKNDNIKQTIMVISFVIILFTYLSIFFPDGFL
ncbi:MAG: hypothetical protein ACK4K1_02030 [Flavobacterium sp.]